VRICIIGKYPPIQGGVSARTYWSAHGLAALGHEVHVVTNAKETLAPFGMLMRAEDWKRCTTVHSTGSVTVHWTDPVDPSQSYIPMASPFVSKLAATAARAHSERPFDVIYSHYLEPYGVAGFLAAQITRVPHVVRMAGSDAGRLWHHPQLELLYDHVLRTAESVIAVGPVAERAIKRGVSPNRIVSGGAFVVPEDLFRPEGPKLNIAALRAEAREDPEFRDLIWGNFAADRPYFGVYGKLGERKGTFALLAAMHRLILTGLEIGLVALAHGGPTIQRDFRARVKELGLADRVLQIPFLPHWRVPEFLRGCLAVCCLEQGFPIVFHTPVIAREVLLCGTCLVGSTEVIRKLSPTKRLPYSYGYIAVEDVNDIDVLSETLATIARVPRIAMAIGDRGRKFAVELQRNMPSLRLLQGVLEAAARRKTMPAFAPSAVRGFASEVVDSRFPLTQLVVAATRGSITNQYLDETAIPLGQTINVASAGRVLAGFERGVGDGHMALQPLAAAVRIEIAIAAAEDDAGQALPAGDYDPLLWPQSRLSAEGGITELVLIRDPRLRIIEFDLDVSDFLGARTAADLPTGMTPSPSYIVAFARSNGKRRDALVIDAMTARILILSNGTRTAAKLVKELAQGADVSVEATILERIENLIVCGMIRFRDEPIEASRIGTDHVYRSIAAGVAGPPGHRRF
jgi:glycosyltransferase involved in cell wall biosynthesis